MRRCVCLHHFSFLKFLPYVTRETDPRPYPVTGLAHRTTDSAVGRPLIGATWVGKYPRVCQWHARTRRRADTWRQGTPRAELYPPTPPPLYTHPAQTHLHLSPHLSIAHHALLLPSGNNTVFLTLSRWSLSVSEEQDCSHATNVVWTCDCVHLLVCICIFHFHDTYIHSTSTIINS